MFPAKKKRVSNAQKTNQRLFEMEKGNVARPETTTCILKNTSSKVGSLDRHLDVVKKTHSIGEGRAEGKNHHHQNSRASGVSPISEGRALPAPQQRQPRQKKKGRTWVPNGKNSDRGVKT